MCAESVPLCGRGWHYDNVRRHRQAGVPEARSLASRPQPGVCVDTWWLRFHELSAPWQFRRHSWKVTVSGPSENIAVGVIDGTCGGVYVPDNATGDSLVPLHDRYSPTVTH